MKKTIYSFAVVILISIAVASAQTTVNDSISRTANRSNTLSAEKSSQAVNWRDSVKKSKAVNQQEKDVLNKDYNNVSKDYKQNKQLANNQIDDPAYKKDAESLKMYKNDKKEYYEDKAALKNQHRKFDKANADGVITDQERAKIEAQYKKDKRHYKDDKKTVNRQKKQMAKDSSRN